MRLLQLIYADNMVQGVRLNLVKESRGRRRVNSDLFMYRLARRDIS